MSGGHGRVVCSCGNVIMQCRCPWNDATHTETVRPHPACGREPRNATGAKAASDDGKGETIATMLIRQAEREMRGQVGSEPIEIGPEGLVGDVLFPLDLWDDVAETPSAALAAIADVLRRLRARGWKASAHIEPDDPPRGDMVHITWCVERDEALREREDAARAAAQAERVMGLPQLMPCGEKPAGEGLMCGDIDPGSGAFVLCGDCADAAEHVVDVWARRDQLRLVNGGLLRGELSQ